MNTWPVSRFEVGSMMFSSWPSTKQYGKQFDCTHCVNDSDELPVFYNRTKQSKGLRQSPWLVPLHPSGLRKNGMAGKLTAALSSDCTEGYSQSLPTWPHFCQDQWCGLSVWPQDYFNNSICRPSFPPSWHPPGCLGTSPVRGKGSTTQPYPILESSVFVTLIHDCILASRVLVRMCINTLD